MLKEMIEKLERSLHIRKIYVSQTKSSAARNLSIVSNNVSRIQLEIDLGDNLSDNEIIEKYKVFKGETYQRDSSCYKKFIKTNNLRRN